MKKLVFAALILVNVSAFSADGDGSGSFAGRYDDSVQSSKADGDGSGSQPKNCEPHENKKCKGNGKADLLDWLTDWLR